MDIKFNLTQGEGVKRTLEVEVPAETIEARLQAAYLNYSKTLKLPGFRQGKIPISIVKSRFGKAIEGEVLNDLVPEFYKQAWKRSGIEPISQPVIDDVSYSSGEKLSFKASLEVKPEIDLKKHTGLRGTRTQFRISDTDVERQINHLREKSAEDQSVDRPAQLGDMLVGDFQEIDSSGVHILGRKYEDRTFLIGGERSFSHDFDNQMVGATHGDNRRVRFTYNQDLAESDLAGKEAAFEVSVKDVRERKIPAIDVEFAKDHGAKDLDDFYERTREQLKTQADYASQKRLESNILSELVRENLFDPPETMVTNALDAIVEEYTKEHEGHDHPVDEAQIRDQNRDMVIYQIRTHLLLEAVSKQEGLVVTDEDIDERIKKMAEVNRQNFKSLKRNLERNNQIERIQRDIAAEIPLQFLIDRAQIEEVEEDLTEGGRIITP